MLFSFFLRLAKLPPTLHNRTHVAATSYSKVSRGLHFPLEIPGLCTRRVRSEGSNWGQWEPRYATRASRHSIDKVLRYLKRVIVTPAVYQLLAQMSQPFCFAKQNQIFGQAFLLVKKGCLEPSLKYWHWAGVTDYTHLYRLAVS